MTDNINMEEEMTLSSGIAAFEAKHFVRAAELLGPLAETGDAEAQYRVAIMAQNGLGMVENQSQAYRHMRAAAEAGLPLAQHGLGFMYLEGECVDKSPEKALEWFMKGAGQGLHGSMATIAMMYQDGNGVAADQEKAREWFHKAGFDEM